MIHETHSLKAYMGEVYKPLCFCVKCGREEDEGLEEPCKGKFVVSSQNTIDTAIKKD